MTTATKQQYQVIEQDRKKKIFRKKLTWGLFYKTFYGRNLRILGIS